MSEKSRISVVIPIYNTAKYLNACIESVLNQTYQNFDIILVDDESPDEAPQMCDEWVKKDNRIQVIHKKNEGLGLTRNAGINVADGDYICFLDSDDTLDADTFEGCIEAFEVKGADACFYGRKTGQADGSFSINKNIPDKLEYTGREVREKHATTYLGPLPEDEGVRYIQVSACCAMYRLSIIKDNNIRFLSERKCLSEDTFFNLDVCKYANKVVIIPKDYYNYTYNGESLTKRYNPNRFNQLKGFYEQLHKYMSEFSDADRVNIRVPYQLYVYLRHTVEYEVKSYKLNGLVKTYKKIKSICNDEFIHESLKEIDLNSLNGKRKMFIKWMLNKRVLNIMAFYILK